MLIKIPKAGTKWQSSMANVIPNFKEISSQLSKSKAELKSQTYVLSPLNKIRSVRLIMRFIKSKCQQSVINFILNNHIYTDGSAENAPRNVKCGAYIKHPGKPPLSVSAPGGILCSNYRAEVLALLNATETIILWEEKPKKAVFLTDSLSALQALISGEPDTTQTKLTKEHQHPRSNYLCCSSMDTSTHHHQGK